MRGSPPECADMIREILVKLPTRDVARSCCVSKLWRSVVTDPAFRRLHAEATNHVVAGPSSETLLVCKTSEHGRPDEASVFNVSTSKPICRRVTIPSGYSLSNICNGFLCFAHDDGEAPAVVFNPVTGETMVLPKAPPFTLIDLKSSIRHLFALGFSPSTKEHKLFRLSFPWYSSGHVDEIYLGAYTLGGGGGGGWRQRSYLFPSPLYNLPPVLVDGKLYVVTIGSKKYGERKKPDRMLVVDVATEAHRTYRLPYDEEEYHSDWYEPQVSPFEMNGRLCLAVNITKLPRRMLQFWVMSPPPPEQQLEDDDSKLYWDLRYKFYIDNPFPFTRIHFTMKGAWFDDGEMTLCYRYGDVLYKHGTRGRSPESSPEGDCLPCDRRLQLPAVPSLLKCSWKICGGYRPSLLSPLTFAPPPSQDDDEHKGQEEFEHALLRALR